MQQDSQPNDDRALRQTDVNLEALRRHLEYELVETLDYVAYDIGTHRSVIARTREETLEKLKSLAPDAQNVRCEKIRIRRRRQPAPGRATAGN